MRTSRLTVDYFANNADADAELLAESAALEAAVLEARRAGGAEEQRFFTPLHLQCGAATRVVGFDKCFLANSFGLVGRSVAVIQPREGV